MSARALMIAAPSSGAGKTTVTLGILRALRLRALDVRGAKSGPDYIDPRFHAAATGQEALNLDAFAMTPARLCSLVAREGLTVVEAAMGLFDGAFPEGRGSAAALAKALDIPVVLVIDCASMAQSVAAIAAGFVHHDPQIRIAGLILNRVGSPRHEAMLRSALGPLCAKHDIALLGAVHRDSALMMPARHLGLVQAGEHPDLEGFLDLAAGRIAASLDLARLCALASAPKPAAAARLAPPAQRIALARDAAFAFAYPHQLADWHAQGAEILPFSPLNDDPVPPADFTFLPGGYPELHAGTLASNARFLTSLRAQATTTPTYGECGGYMVLGETLIDAEGRAHKMAGLLDLTTSFATRKLHLGYREVFTDHAPLAGAWAAHEFHYATTQQARGAPLFSARDASGAKLPDMGLRAGHSFGSFAHLIDRRFP